MGEVYKGYNIQTGDPVAIKMIRSDLAENEAALQLFRKEASSLHNLHHEAIVRYYIFTVDPVLSRAYLAMEYVDGISLKDLLVRGPLSFEQVCILQHRIASGLQAAHKMGIIHRDISPDNVLAPGGNLAEAKILDFGIARSTKAGEQTIIGSGFAGKYNYVSPEQLGMFGGNVTGKSDIYSLGLVLAECLIGRPIDMSGSQVDVIDKRRVIPDLSGIDPRFRPLLTEMLSPHPDDRPDDMAAVAAWVPSKKGTKFNTKRPVQANGGESRGGGKVPMIAAAMVALVGLGGAGAYFGMTMLNGSGSNSQLAQEERRAQQNQQAEAATRAAEAKRLADEQQQATQKREAEARETAARAEAERVRLAEEQRVAEERRQAELRKQEEEQRAAQLRKQAEEQMTVAARQEAARKEAESKTAEAKRVEEEKRQAELRRIEEEKRKAAEAKRLEDEKKAAEAKRVEEDKRAAELRRKQEDERKAAEVKRLEDEKKTAEARRIEEEKRAADLRRKQEEERKAAEAKSLEDEKKAAEARRIEEDRVREEARRVEQERHRA